MASNQQRQAFLVEHNAIANQAIALVSPDMPLRANLSALDNIALIPQYRDNLAYDIAADTAWLLLDQAGHQAIAYKRDPDLSHAERCVTKLLRAVIGEPPIILIERPALLLPDTNYPSFLFDLLQKLSQNLKTCWIVDYEWNQPLYAERHIQPSHIQPQPIQPSPNQPSVDAESSIDAESKRPINTQTTLST
jgi:ABC-type lipoprotein export system ATPase subunit